MQKYFDDEEISRLKSVTEPNSGTFEAEGTTATYYNKRDASLKSEKFTVLLELTGTEGAEDDRPGLDIVIVLDVSGSMRGKKLEHMKIATKFLVKKLSPVDRLSVVIFSNQAHRICPLTLMTQDAQTIIEGKIQDLQASGGTNITAGLEEAVQVLNDRRFTDGREVAIMFMSDGNPSNNYDGSNVSFGKVPVHTFGLGQDYHPKVLMNIAERSNGGTFNTSDVEHPETSSLSMAFAQCLAGLLSVVVKDLTLVITKQKSVIEKVFAGNYPQTRDDSEGTVTITFGTLYSRETRNVLVNLVLEEVKKPRGTDILEFTYTYKKVIDGNEYDVPPVTITVSRTETPSGQEIPEVLNEKARLDTAEKMKDARIMADGKNFDGAKAKLNEAEQDLKRNELDQSDPMIAGLLAEVKQFTKLMESPEIYEKLGRAFAFASELSHNLQRASARGDVNEIRLFATKAMDQLLEQVQNYENDPNYVVPTSAEDLTARVAEDKAKAEANQSAAPEVADETQAKGILAAIADFVVKHDDGRAVSVLKGLQNRIHKRR